MNILTSGTLSRAPCTYLKRPIGNSDISYCPHVHVPFTRRLREKGEQLWSDAQNRLSAGDGQVQSVKYAA